MKTQTTRWTTRRTTGAAGHFEDQAPPRMRLSRKGTAPPGEPSKPPPQLQAASGASSGARDTSGTNTHPPDAQQKYAKAAAQTLWDDDFLRMNAAADSLASDALGKAAEQHEGIAGREAALGTAQEASARIATAVAKRLLNSRLPPGGRQGGPTLADLWTTTPRPPQTTSQQDGAPGAAASTQQQPPQPPP